MASRRAARAAVGPSPPVRLPDAHRLAVLLLPAHRLLLRDGQPPRLQEPDAGHAALSEECRGAAVPGRPDGGSEPHSRIRAGDGQDLLGHLAGRSRPGLCTPDLRAASAVLQLRGTGRPEAPRRGPDLRRRRGGRDAADRPLFLPVSPRRLRTVAEAAVAKERTERMSAETGWSGAAA